MQKNVLIGASICAVLIFILGSSTNVEGYQTLQLLNQKPIGTNENVTVVIRAGIHEKTNGNYGIGWLVKVGNLLNRSVKCHIIAFWNTTDSTNDYTYDQWITVDPYLMVGIGYAYGHRFYPIFEVTVTATIPDPAISLTRSGVQIGRFLFFPNI